MSDLAGACLCGAVSYRVRGKARGVSVCHCGQCRRQSGHLWSSAFAPAEDIEVTGEVRWYEASPTAKRGFCPVCGAFLFWKAHDEGTMSFSMGSLEKPTGLRLEKHIFTEDKGDYYDLPEDGLPRS